MASRSRILAQFGKQFTQFRHHVPRCACTRNSYSSLASTADSTEINTETLFTSQHAELRKTCRAIIDKDINPYVDQWEKDEQFPSHEVFKKLGQAGLLGVNKPPEYGGMGLDYTYQAAFLEELGYMHCGAIPMAVAVQTDMATPALARFGSDELKRNFLAPTVAGDVVCSIGVSESGAGSDVSSIKTKAVKQGDDYVINGSKMWITNGHMADWVCLLVNTSDGQAHANKSLIVVPMDTKGVTRARKIAKMGMKCSDTAELFFEDVRVPQSHLIGEEGMGFQYQMMQFQEERLAGGLMSIVPMDILIQQTIDYTRQRKAFGQPLLDNQVIHFKMAELLTEVECLRSLSYRAVGKMIQGENVTMLASMIKLKAGRLLREVSDSCLQYWGGMGFTDDVLVSRLYRDMRLVSIGGGADEVMLGIICKLMGTLPKAKRLV